MGSYINVITFALGTLKKWETSCNLQIDHDDLEIVVHDEGAGTEGDVRGRLR